MNKQELITNVATTLGFTKKDTTEVVDKMVITIMDALSKGESVSIPHFGKFEVRNMPARLYHNPRTGEMIKGAPTKKVAFKASAALKNSVKGE